MISRLKISRRSSVLLVATGASAVALLGSSGAMAGPAGPNTVPSKSSAGPVADVAAGDRFAVVNADGSFARGKGVLSSSSVGTGSYQVLFNRNVSQCGFIATVGSSASSGTEPTGQITTVRRVGTTNGVFIATSDSSGASSARGFHLLVACP